MRLRLTLVVVDEASLTDHALGASTSPVVCERCSDVRAPQPCQTLDGDPEFDISGEPDSKIE